MGARSTVAAGERLSDSVLTRRDDCGRSQEKDSNSSELENLRKRLGEVENQLREARENLKRLRIPVDEARGNPTQEMQPFVARKGIIGSSSLLRQTLSQVRQVAATDSTVLLLGETGTGKELIASALHDLSSRARRNMVIVNCAAIPATLMESELFGREKGAYTGAVAKQIGRFEMANGSTLFLDEVGELSADMQAKLLRVLQDMKLQRLGSNATVRVDVRLVAATNRDLPKLVREGRFRQDLYYRLNVFPIRVPPLRERPEDIPILVSAFIAEFAKAMGKEVRSIRRSDMRALEAYSWPGNVRELRNVVERAVILAQGSELRVELPGTSVGVSHQNLTMEVVEREHIRNVLSITAWRVRGKGGAAELLGLEPNFLLTRMAQLGLRQRNLEGPV